MSITTSIGTWATVVGSTYGSMTQDIAGDLGEYAEDHDLDAIETDYRDAINAALPEGVTLAGDEFYGPAHEAIDRDAIREAVEGVDFWAIAERHAR